MIALYFWKILGMAGAVYLFYDNYKKNRIGLGLILAAITVFFPFFLIIYVNFKSKKPIESPTFTSEKKQSFCSKCGHTNDKHLRKCTACSNILSLE
jgi:hypothetical protein